MSSGPPRARAAGAGITRTSCCAGSRPPSPHRFRGAAGARGFTHAQFLTALVSLHEAMRKRADDGDAEMAAALDQLGLGTVSI